MSRSTRALLSRGFLHVAANAKSFYPTTLLPICHPVAAWVQQTGMQSISYEGVRHLGVTTPYATGDAAAPIQDLNPYGAWEAVGWRRCSNLECAGHFANRLRRYEAFAPPAHPTYLFYNPYTNRPLSLSTSELIRVICMTQSRVYSWLLT